MATSINTLKSAFGYLGSVTEKCLGVTFKRDSIAGIFNFLPLDNRIYTSGQPTEKQFHAIKNTGASVVINLAPGSAENALADERRIVESFSMKYIHMPVNFKAPTEQNYREFVDLMNIHRRDVIWVHCAANMRVSAFLYRYRIEYEGVNPEAALKDLSQIWKPFGVWEPFVSFACVEKEQSS